MVFLLSSLRTLSSLKKITGITGFNSFIRTTTLTGTGTLTGTTLLKTTLSHQIRSYSSDIEPMKKKDYSAYVNQWKTHFIDCQDNFELERGLNIIFAADWVPDVIVVTEALKASRRLNTYATAVRILGIINNKIIGGIKDKCNKTQFDEYKSELSPLIKELDIQFPHELNEFKSTTVRDKDRWWY